MDRPLLKKFLDVMGEVKGLCTGIMVRGAYKHELDNIKRLQMEVQSINVDDLVNEIFSTTPDDKDGIKKALYVYDYRLKDKLFKVDIDEANITDVGDNGEVLKHFVDEAARLQATAPDNLKSFYMCEKDANEFVMRLHNILEWCNDINSTFVSEYKKLSSWLGPEPQQIEIPEELQTHEAKSIFEKAIKAGLMVSTETGCYQWQKSTALLAYMCGRLFCGDRIVKDIAGEDVIQKGSDYFPETVLNQLFQTKNLGQSHQQLKDKRPPRGHECVDDLF
jgi:hypothetical protein